jgi:hypothetical protein
MIPKTLNKRIAKTAQKKKPAQKKKKALPPPTTFTVERALVDIFGTSIVLLDFEPKKMRNTVVVCFYNHPLNNDLSEDIEELCEGFDFKEWKKNLEDLPFEDEKREGTFNLVLTYTMDEESNTVRFQFVNLTFGKRNAPSRTELLNWFENNGYCTAYEKYVEKNQEALSVFL